MSMIPGGVKNPHGTFSGRRTGIALFPSSLILRSRIVSGSLTLLAGSGLAGVMNLVYNLAVARLLGPAGFAHATAVYTLLILMSAITLSFQTVCAKLIAKCESPGEKAAVYTRLHRTAWLIGLAICALLILTRGAVSSYLNLHNTFLVILLGVGTAFYIPLGVRRGRIQGNYSFNLLALNFFLEGLVRLGGALLLITLGMGVTGAVLATVAGVMVAYLCDFPRRKTESGDALKATVSFREGLQAIVFFAGQAIINNFDIVLVKHFFPAQEAGLYAAAALVGRLVNMCAWSVISTMFPLSAGTRSKEREARRVLMTSLLLVFLILAVLILCLLVVPSLFWKSIFGARFEVATYGSISSLMILYAITTGIYSFSMVIISYEMSRKIANTAWVQLAFSGALMLGIYSFHTTLRQVILVQLVLMCLLLIAVLLPFLRHSNMREVGEIQFPNETFHAHRPLTQEQVIAEFLRNEFHHSEFDSYRDRFQHLVSKPDLNSREQNDLRRALLFLRRGALWRELPLDTQWFEVELTSRDLSRIRVFPRAHWRRFAEGSFYLTDIVGRIRAQTGNPDHEEFFSKLRLLSTAMREKSVASSVLLIGVDDSMPVTILDGNHRIAAAMLAAPSDALQHFRFLCGFSPRMTECCWYQTNMSTLWRYAKNLVRHIYYDPEIQVLIKAGLR